MENMTWPKAVRLAVSLALLVIAGLTFLLVLTETISFYEVPTGSMRPLLQPGDRIAAARSGSYERGDVVVVNDPAGNGDYLVKRIVAVGGDTVAVQGGRLFVNNRMIEEPYLREAMDYRFGPLTVEPGTVFLLGDNRNESEDSHLWMRGLPEDTIRGKVRMIYSPGKRRGGVDHGREHFAGLG
jgi:signal peptidase I